MVEGEEPPPPEAMQRAYQDVDALNDQLKAEGAWVFAGGLHPPDTATVVSLREGEVLTTDGPFAEAKEQPDRSKRNPKADRPGAGRSPVAVSVGARHPGAPGGPIRR